MVDATTADALEALAKTIFDPDTGTGLQGQDAATDAQYYALIAPAMLAIDGRTMPQGWRYSLNITNALGGRPKHWFQQLQEWNTANVGTTSKYPCQSGLVYTPNTAEGFAWWANSYGYTIGLATMAAICQAWAQIIRLWLNGNYPAAVSLP